LNIMEEKTFLEPDLSGLSLADHRENVLPHIQKVIALAKYKFLKIYTDEVIKSIESYFFWLFSTEKNLPPGTYFPNLFESRYNDGLPFGEMTGLAFTFLFDPLLPGSCAYNLMTNIYRESGRLEIGNNLFVTPEAPELITQMYSMGRVYSAYLLAMDESLLNAEKEWLCYPIESVDGYTGFYLLEKKDGSISKFKDLTKWNDLVSSEHSVGDTISSYLNQNYSEQKSLVYLFALSAKGEFLFRGGHEPRWHHMENYTRKKMNSEKSAYEFRERFQKYLYQPVCPVFNAVVKSDELSRRIGHEAYTQSVVSDSDFFKGKKDSLAQLAQLIYERNIISAVSIWELDEFIDDKVAIAGYGEGEVLGKGQRNTLAGKMIDKQTRVQVIGERSVLIVLMHNSSEFMLQITMPYNICEENIIIDDTKINQNILSLVSSVGHYSALLSTKTGGSVDRYIDLEEMDSFEKLESLAIRYISSKMKTDEQLGDWLGVKRPAANRRRRNALNFGTPDYVGKQSKKSGVAKGKEPDEG
jgi:hypothetical protein